MICIKNNRLAWAGHMICMDINKIRKKIHDTIITDKESWNTEIKMGG